MMITQTMLLAVLRYIRERSPWISGYRRWPDGKIRRYIDWNRVARRELALAQEGTQEDRTLRNNQPNQPNRE